MDIDIKLLRIFQAIYQHQSISKAGDILNISQPSASVGLNKLRKHFNNPLFVRVGNHMIPTETAKELAPLIDEAIEKMQLVNSFKKAFNPQLSTRQFVIGLTDISHLNLVPRLIQFLQHSAPNIRLNFVPIDGNTPNHLINGQVDLAIGFIPQLEAGFYQQILFHEKYVALVNQNHPTINEQLTLEDYEREEHIEIMPNGTGHYLLESELRKKGIHRKIKIQLPGYLGVALAVQQSHLIATVPSRLGHLLSFRGNKSFDLPFVLSGYEIKQHWHERMHKNPENQWLRQVCFQLFKKLNE